MTTPKPHSSPLSYPLRSKLDAATADQIDRLHLDPDSPLIICDADEVLVVFLRMLERFMHHRGCHLRLDDYRLTGNIRYTSSGDPLPASEVSGLISDFFAAETQKLPPVESAAEALEALSGRAQIVVLTNLPHDFREARRAGLSSHGMPYPVITNTGRKGAAVAHLANRLRAPAVFIDDTPAHLGDARDTAPDVHRLHFVADERLKAILGDPEEAHAHATRWPEAVQLVHALFQRHV